MRITATVSLTETKDGGRHGPIHSEYRPDWDIGRRTPDGQVWFFAGIIRDLERDELLPGETCGGVIEPLSPDAWVGIRPGVRLTFFEGPSPVGSALVISVRN